MSANPIDLNQIIAAIRIAALGGEELWGFDEIAAHSKFERNYVVNYITALPDFPRPIRVGKDGKGHPRYIAHEVIAWFKARQEKAA
jgi:hypothetical protein